MNGVLTSEEPEVPFITPGLLPDDMETYAVIHALPIGRIEGDGFIPRYTLYVLTYYAAEPDALRERRWQEWTRGRKTTITHNWYAARLTDYWEIAKEKPDVWDLTAWVGRGKLLWIDASDPTLPLRPDVAGFPYGNVPGLRHGYCYRPEQPLKTEKTRNTIERFHSITHFFEN